MSGAGKRMAPVHGNHYGPLSVTLQWHGPFSCTAAPSRPAQEGANVTAPVFHAQLSANVKGAASIMMVVMQSDGYY